MRKGYRSKNSPSGGADKDGQGGAHASGAFSDSEADIGFRSYNYDAYLPTLTEEGKRTRGYEPLPTDYGNLTDQEDDYGGRESGNSVDEFGDREQQNVANRLVRTGRQRKKLAARSKGGEFRQRRKKRRLYFCCVSSDIDVQKLFDYLVGAGSMLNGWKYQLHADVLHLYKPGIEDPLSGQQQARSSRTAGSKVGWGGEADPYAGHGGGLESVDMDDVLGEKGIGIELEDRDRVHRNDGALLMRSASIGADDEVIREAAQRATMSMGGGGPAADDVSRIAGVGAQEVFVFDFGAAVFWGFSRGEETNLLKTIRMFVTKGFVGAQEFQSGEDDMAFVTMPDAEGITIANDVITLPDDSPAKQRMSVSFAIAQSTVLAIFESRVERKVEDYRYIPEALAASGKVHLTERQLGTMIGEVFVIRHDVNLHTEILDTPDFFWHDGQLFENDYQMVMGYLEMSGRTEVLNKRLDMLRELLDVLQQQMENAHAVKLEWIVIWLIVIEVLLQVCAVGGESMGWWSGGSL